MKKLIIVTTMVACAVVFIAGCFYGPPAYRHYKEARGLRQARQFLGAGDFADESLSLRQVLQLNPKNIEACLMMAELAEFSHSPATIDWRNRVAELAPSVANRLKLASCALRFQRPPYPLASQALQDLEPMARDVAAFHVISAELALKMNRADEAAAHFEQAARIEPKTELHQLNLAVLRLQSSNVATKVVARHTLEQLTTNTNLAPLALRWLVAESLRQNDLSSAERLSLRLLADPQAQFDDCLQRLSILQCATNLTENTTNWTNLGSGGTAKPTSNILTQPVALSSSGAFTEYLSMVQFRAATNAVELYLLCEWMGGHGLANEALQWLAALDAKIKNSQLVRLAVAKLYLVKADWAALERSVGGQKWADLEFLRWALLARATWGQNHDVVGKACWRGAVRAADERIGSLTLLLNLAEEWGRDPEELLWQIGRRFPREQWALRELERRYLAVGNTRGLNLVYGSMANLKASASDSSNRNNFVNTLLLLKKSLPSAHETARDLYDQNPADVIVASTYAYSLHLQGRTREGLAVFQRFEPRVLETPSIALYYGVLLAAGGEKERAGRFLAMAEGAGLLPEEKEMLQTANRQIRTLTGL
jgi:Tfp pilus assembly protein PilF